MNSNSATIRDDMIAVGPRPKDRLPTDAASFRAKGTEAFRSGDYTAAIAAFSAALDCVPIVDEEAELCALIGACHRRLGAAAAAVDSYVRAADLSPDDAHVLNGLATMFAENGQFARAEETLAQVLAKTPSAPEAQYNLGCIRQQQGLHTEAIESFRSVLERFPDNNCARFNMGYSLYATGEFAAASDAFQRVCAKEPSASIAWERLGFAHIAAGNFEAATRAFFNLYVLSQDREMPIPGYVNTVLQQHNADQARYLSKRVQDTSPLAPEDGYQLVEQPDPVSLTGTRLSLAQPSGHCHVMPVATKSAAINPDWQKEYDNGIVVIDELLTPGALSALQEFCLDARIWSDPGTGSEINSAMQDGFFAPLLFQIAGELRSRLPDLLGSLVLSSAWSYKYYDARSRGRVHADSGAVTVNFWITPKSFALDDEAGGMLFWDARVPDDYFARDFRAQEAMIEAMGIWPKAWDHRVEYNCNRAVVFPSRQIHQTDAFRFAEEYCGRRTSVTLSFDRPG